MGLPSACNLIFFLCSTTVRENMASLTMPTLVLLCVMVYSAAAQSSNINNNWNMNSRNMNNNNYNNMNSNSYNNNNWNNNQNMNNNNWNMNNNNNWNNNNNNQMWRDSSRGMY